MAISRYWRLVGICTSGNGALELSEARIYENGVLADAGATLTATIDPDSGALADLRDDLTDGVVSWSYEKYSQPGFALVWDFGVGGGLEYVGFRLGSGSSEATFLQDGILQHSADGIVWAMAGYTNNCAFPGAQSLTEVPGYALDINYANVALLLRANGTNGSHVFSDSSLLPKIVSTVGAPLISTDQSRFGGASVYLDGSDDYLTAPSSADFDFSADFTVEAWIRPSRVVGTNAVVCRQEIGTGAVFQFRLNDSVLQGVLRGTGGIDIHVLSGGVVTTNTWQHVAFARRAANTYLFLDGDLVASGTSSVIVIPSVARPLILGAVDDGSTPTSFFQGFIDEVRVTNTVSRYTSSFTPQDSAFGDWNLLPAIAPVPSRTRQLAPSPERLLPATELPVTTVHGHLREFPFFDVYNGGMGLITGTVKEKALPANTPLHRKVWLMDEASGMVIRETWSDATTGNYEFRAIKQGVKYTVLAYDYTGSYRAVIADAQIPELIP